MEGIGKLCGAVGLAALLISATALAERINQEGRILGSLPALSAPTLFNTAEADAVVSAMQIFPVTSAWNEDVSRRPLLANSSAMIAQIKADLLSSRQTLRLFYEMNYVLVPDSQPRVTIPFLDYPDESDLDGGTFPNGRYPISSNMPIETWPRGTGGLTLQQWQMDVNNTGGDRHAIIVAPGVGSIWEMWEAKLTGNGWQASNGAKFDLNSNTLRPAGWTSGDAAGLPMFPALVRYDECQRGMVEHAMRLVVARTRREYIYPANHYASSIPASSINYPAMGQRLRLKASFAILSNWTKEEQAVLKGLKKYGAIVADNGNFFSISVCPDDRFSATAFNNLSAIDISNFEVVQTTGANEGPRSPGAPTVDAGTDQTVSGNTATLAGSVNDPSGNAAIQWKLYAGPAPVTFDNPSSPSVMVSFSRDGTYTLMLSAEDGAHAVAYDAVVVTVQSSPTPTPTPTPTVTPSPTGRPSMSISVSPSQVSEGSDATFTITSSDAVSQPLTVYYAIKGSAQNGVDYTLSGTPGQVTIPVGASSATIGLHARPDSHTNETDETVTLRLVSDPAYRVPRPARADLIIVNVP